MKKQIWSIALATVAGGALFGVATFPQAFGISPSAAQVQVAERAENFRLVDQKSASHELTYYRYAPAIIIISTQNGSKNVRAAVPALKALKAAYAGKDVPIFLLNSTPADSRDAIAAEMASLGLDLPVLIDDTQLIGESLGVSRVTQAFVIDPKTWKVVYSGPLDDRFAGKTANPNAKVSKAYVSDAVASLIAGQPVQLASAKLEAPEIAFPLRDNASDFAKISYAKDVAPILSKNCVACHSEGSIGPFAMDEYEKVKGFSGMIREAIRTDRMPPYSADPHVGKWSNDISLSREDQQTLVHWIEAGAPRGEGPDPLKIDAKPAPEWELGTPDMIIELEPYKVPASGLVDYQNPEVSNPLVEGRWLRAATVKPSDRKAVHHLLSNGVGSYAVGAETFVNAPGSGTWVEPKTPFKYQMHYTPYGKEVVEKTRVGLYFYPKDKPPEVFLRVGVLANIGIDIPPNTAEHEEVAYMVFPENATLFSVSPHAHYRGERVSISLLEPGAKKEKLIFAMPKYDFSWQRAYDFAEPLKVKAGTKLVTRYVFDNSKNNRANPDPNLRVTWGEQSWQEMQYTEVFFRWDDETVANRKDDYQKRMEATRNMGMMDVNLDDRIAKSEVRGRMGERITAEWDKLDTDKDGYLVESELGALAQMMQRSINSSRD